MLAKKSVSITQRLAIMYDFMWQWLFGHCQLHE